MAKSVAINHSRIRRDCALFKQECWLLVVLTEGYDLCCPSDREKWPEACEIGEQGNFGRCIGLVSRRNVESLLVSRLNRFTPNDELRLGNEDFL